MLNPWRTLMAGEAPLIVELYPRGWEALSGSDWGEGGGERWRRGKALSPQYSDGLGIEAQRLLCGPWTWLALIEAGKVWAGLRAELQASEVRGRWRAFSSGAPGRWDYPLHTIPFYWASTVLLIHQMCVCPQLCATWNLNDPYFTDEETKAQRSSLAKAAYYAVESVFDPRPLCPQSPVLFPLHPSISSLR